MVPQAGGLAPLEYVAQLLAGDGLEEAVWLGLQPIGIHHELGQVLAKLPS